MKIDHLQNPFGENLQEPAHPDVLGDNDGGLKLADHLVESVQHRGGAEALLPLLHPSQLRFPALVEKILKG